MEISRCRGLDQTKFHSKKVRGVWGRVRALHRTEGQLSPCAKAESFLKDFLEVTGS